ncbi:MAG TPA: asparagine synthase (glutamine-hydrolyzing) [Opitutaceae bacterium]|nr:asparagine synthase (glutamine-hydrolyzing) [Opitutaceae bacterium]
MCGIAGYFGSAPFDPAPWLGALEHRGPDANGLWRAPEAGGRTLHFAHTRLKILDLTEAGAQPMVLERGGAKFALSFNGEIYNYRELRAELASRGWEFRGTGDTEVLLKGYAEWGPAVFAKCDGMFAVAVYDRPRRRLVLARGHTGIKPLYVANTADGGIAFASEVRALMRSGMVARTLDREAVGDFLRLGSFQEPATVFEAIRAFPAGAFCELPLDGAALPSVRDIPVTRYWSPEWFAPSGADSDRDWNAEHAAILRDTVRDQLVSDVPVGVFLSGGLDSTVLIEQLTGDDRERVTAFTLGGEVTTNDEVDVAARSAANLGVRHTAVRLASADLASWVGDGLDAMDQPSYDGINTYLVSRASRAADLVVVLSGAGADELHGAYGHAAQLTRFIRLVTTLGPLGKSVGSLAGEVLGWGRGEVAGERLKLMVAAVPDAWKVLLERRRFLTPSRMGALWPDCPPGTMPAPMLDFEKFAALDTVAQVTAAEIAGYLRNTLLRDCDWATMACHQELRVPYLGRRYMEFMLGAPASVKAPGDGLGKQMLASLLSEANRELVSLPKRGFILNYRELILGRFRSEFEDACATLRTSLGFAIDSRALLEELAGPDTGKLAVRLWALFALGRYLGQPMNS